MSRQLRQFESSWSGDGQLQKIYSSARFICLSMRSQGRTRYIYLGRGKGFEGLWEGEKQIPSSLRKKDQMLEYMRKHLSGRAFLGLELDPIDRVLWIHYQSFGKKSSFGFFYHGRNLYFANLGPDPKGSELGLFKSWEKGSHAPMKLRDVFDEVGKKAQNTMILSPRPKSISILLEQELKEGLSQKRRLSKKTKFLKRKKKNIQDDLEKAKLWRKLNTWLDEQDDLSLLNKKINVEGVKLNFKEKTHFKRRDEVYDKIKKLKRGEGILLKRLEEASSGESLSKEPELKSTLEVIRPVWPNSTKESKKEKGVQNTELGFKVFKFDGFELGIGESAQGNDQLRKVWAKKDDVWLHLDQASGPHIVLKSESMVLEQDVLQKVGELMRKYAQSDASELNLIYTQVKNLKGVKGKAGAVNFKKEKRIRIFLN